MDTMLAVEDRKLECGFQLRELKGKTPVDSAAVTKKEAHLEMIEGDWMVAGDMLTLAQGCADVASPGKLAKTWQMWEVRWRVPRGLHLR